MHQKSPKLEPYAIVVADMVGYSQRLATHPADTHAAFKAHLDRVFTPTVHHHNGRVIKTTGDGIVAIFVDAGQAERCAREIQLQMENHSKPKMATFPIKYRVAGHYGTVMVERNDVFGLDINIAIHLQHLAPPGGVCLSGALFSRLAEQGKQGYQFLGRRYLNNIPTPIAIYAHGPAPSTPAWPQPGQLAASTCSMARATSGRRA